MQATTKATRQRTVSTDAERRRNLAFNQGCDAALSGAAMGSCPYKLGSVLAALWQNGWNDIKINRRLGRV